MLNKKILLTISMIFLSVHVFSQTIPKDKQLHIYAVSFVSAWSYTIPDNRTLWKPAVYGIGGSVIAGGGKELMDMAGFGTPDVKDFEATVAGGIITTGLITGIREMVRVHKTHVKNGKKYRKNKRFDKPKTSYNQYEFNHQDKLISNNRISLNKVQLRRS